MGDGYYTALVVLPLFAAFEGSVARRRR